MGSKVANRSSPRNKVRKILSRVAIRYDNERRVGSSVVSGVFVEIEDFVVVNNVASPTFTC